MKTILVTGGIASGKSEVCRYLSSLGYPVYDCDSRTKALYDNVPGLREKIEESLGIPFAELSRIFTDDSLRKKLEAIVYPLVHEDLASWLSGLSSPAAFVESATAASHPLFSDLYDSILLVRSDESLRMGRNPKAAERAHLQHFDDVAADYTIENNSTITELHHEVDKYLKSFMKTDLAKILAVSGVHGLYEYVAGTRNGVIAECLSDKKRCAFSGTNRVSCLADISIYTSEGELRLADVFTALKGVLGEELAPSSKAPAEEIKGLFIKAIPDYDEDRFYLSHMKKVVDWYNDLAKYASFDFVTDEEREAEAKAAEEE